MTRMVRHNLDSLYDELVTDISQSLIRFGQRVVSDVRSSNEWKGSRVKNSLQFSLMGKTGIRIWSNNPILFYLEYGTKSHRISPRNGTRLKFSNGDFVRREVIHPGNRAYGVVERAAIANLPELMRSISNG